jgi:acetyl-CoA carboxylase biotin carboxyl carrier protein
MTRLPVDADAIRALADILVETGLTEIEIAEGDSRIRVARAPSVIQAAVAGPAMHAAAVPAPAPAPAAAEPAAVTDFTQHPGAVKSPMVGVVYLSPEPGASPFVLPGQPVAAGQTLLLIEAMKTFNQIKAPRAGTVTRIFASAGVPVEYGEVLMVIE